MNLHLVQSIDPKTGGGIASSCIELVEAQNSIGLAAKIVSTTANRDELKSHDYKRLALIKCSNPILYTPDLKKLIEDVNSDWLIHSHGLYMYSSYLGTWIKRRHHNRMIVHVHGILEPWILSRSKITKKIASLLYENFKFRNAEYWRALTSKEADQIRSFGVKGRIVVAPNGINLDVIDDYIMNVSSKSIKDKRILLFLGRIHEKKGLVPLVKVWKGLPMGIRKKWELRIVGPDDGILQKLKGLSNGEDSIKFFESVSGRNKFKMLAESDMNILPSFSEGFSMSLLEACAFRKPIIFTDECNFDDAYHHGGVRLTSIEKWPSELSKYLQMSDTEMSDRGAALRRLVETKYHWNKIAHDLNDQISDEKED